jgi:uncharacterized membrane protein YccC
MVGASTSTGNAGSWSAFWQSVIRFQRHKFAPWIAFRNTIGFTLPIAIGMAAGSVTAGLAVATGALNVSFSDSEDPYRQRARRMIAASLLVGLAVFSGTLAGRNHISAVVVSGVWAFAAGMLVSLSSAAADLGVISLVTLVVYMASPQPPERAFWGALLAIGGGLLQAALAIALWPLRRYAPERRALGALYAELSRAAASPFEASQSPPASVESTDAQTALASLHRNFSIEAERLRLLLSQAERMRISLLMLSRLRTRISRESHDSGFLDRFFEICSRLLGAIGDSLISNDASAADRDELDELHALATAARESRAAGSSHLASLIRDACTQMDAIAGQIRSASDLAASATPEGIVAFERRESRHPWRLRLSGSLATLRANLSLHSAACRHAIRLAVCIAAGHAVARGLGLHRFYWLPMTIAIVLKPDFTATFSRGILRLAGTFTGLIFATALFHLLHPSPPAEVIVIGALMFVMRCFGGANYGLFVVAVTGLVVFMIALTGVAPAEVMMARGLNTAGGGIIALVAYWLWPTWERTHVSENIARMLDAYRAYFRAIRESYENPGKALAQELDRTRVPGRLARSNLEASIERLSAEPGATPEKLQLLNGILASSHRLVHALMALEAGLSDSDPAPPRAAFGPFASDLELTLFYLASILRGSTVSSEALPDLREDHNALIKSGDSLTQRYTLVNIETDRATNSLNTLAGEVLRWAGRIPEPPTMDS